MAKLRQYSSQQALAPAESPRPLQASDFADPGAGAQQAGQQITAMGERLMQAAGRKAAREDGLASVRALEQFETEVAAEQRRIKQEGGYSGHPGMGPSMYASKETKVGFGEFLATKMQETLENTSFELPESKAALMEDLEKRRGLYARAVAEDINTEQRALVKQHLTRNFSEIAADSTVTGNLDDGLKLVRDRVNRYANTMSSSEEEAEYLRGASFVMQEHVQEALMTFNDEGAMAIVNRDDFAPTVGFEKARELKMKVLAQHMTKQKGRLEAEQALIKTATILGIDVEDISPRDRRIMASLESIQKKQSLSEKLAEVDALVRENPERADEIRRLAGMSRQESNIELRMRLWKDRNPGREMPAEVFNQIISADVDGMAATQNERRMNFLLENADAFAAKALAPQDEAKFLALAQAMQNENTKFRTDPVTREVMRIDAALPPFLRSALDAREDVQLQSVGYDAMREGGDIQMPPLDKVTGNRTVFGTMADAVGPVSFAKAKLEDIAFVGELVKGQKNIEAQRRIALSNRLLIAALVNNDRFPVKEMEAVQREFGMDPGAFQSVSGFLSRMVAVKENLMARQAEQYSYLASTGRKSPRKIADSNRIIRDIDQYLDIMGLPDVYEGSDVLSDSFSPDDFEPGEVILVRSPEGEYTQIRPNPVGRIQGSEKKKKQTGQASRNN